jgi:hypothetical protein
MNSLGMDLITRAAVIVLLKQLQGEIGRCDGAAAVRTIEQIGDVAGVEYADRVMNELFMSAMRRLNDGH